MTDKVPLTQAGKLKLEEELRQLKTVERPNVIKQIAEARSHGDLRENAEYHAAREKQGFIEGRIADLEDKLARCEVIDPSTIRSDKVMFGATVHIVDEDEQAKVYQIVGEFEADVKEGKVSVTSPIARALMSKKCGDEVTMNSPKGPMTYTIVKIEYK